MKVDIFNTNNKYDIIYADPPWAYRNMGNIQATANSHYATMKQADIEALPIADLAKENAILFLWATFPKIQEALNTIKAWGFEYKTCGFTWVKKNRGGGEFLRCRLVYQIERRSVFNRHKRKTPESLEQSFANNRNRARRAFKKACDSSRQDSRILWRSAPDRTLCSSIC